MVNRQRGYATPGGGRRACYQRSNGAKTKTLGISNHAGSDSGLKSRFREQECSVFDDLSLAPNLIFARFSRSVTPCTSVLWGLPGRWHRGPRGDPLGGPLERWGGTVTRRRGYAYRSCLGISSVGHPLGGAVAAGNSGGGPFLFYCDYDEETKPGPCEATR
jgi:hypothetical protein